MPTTCRRVSHDWTKVIGVYADGGVVFQNPSPEGGTWGFCYADAQGVRLDGASGYVTPAEIARPWVSNNLTEVLAVLLALEQLPDGWSGHVHSDSMNAIRAAGRAGDLREPCPDWLPPEMFGRLRAVLGRLGRLAFVLLGGHPNRVELAAGRRKDGKPVSAHNVHCDRLCQEAAAAFKAGPLSPDDVVEPDHVVTDPVA